METIKYTEGERRKCPLTCGLYKHLKIPADISGTYCVCTQQRWGSYTSELLKDIVFNVGRKSYSVYGFLVIQS